MNDRDLRILPTFKLFRALTTINKAIFRIPSSPPLVKLRINSHMHQNKLLAA